MRLQTCQSQDFLQFYFQGQMARRGDPTAGERFPRSCHTSHNDPRGGVQRSEGHIIVLPSRSSTLSPALNLAFWLTFHFKEDVNPLDAQLSYSQCVCVCVCPTTTTITPPHLCRMQRDRETFRMRLLLEMKQPLQTNTFKDSSPH